MSTTNDLYAGFARTNITPPMGIDVAGYFKERKADGVLDDLEVNALALKSGESTVLLMTIDHCGVVRPIMDKYKAAISDKTGVPTDAIFFHSTHTHTGPMLLVDTDDVLLKEYEIFVGRRAVDAAVFAIEDMKPARMGYAVGQAPGIAFVRRYRMKDGTIRTNPGVDNPDIVAPIGDVDERVNVLRFNREDGTDIVLANFGNHPDTVGGCKISGDWPSLTRRTFEKVIDNSKCIFFNGAQGDVNHVNVHPAAGDFNDMFNDFDGCSRGYGHTKHMANVVTGAILQVYAKVNYVDVDEIKYIQRFVDAPANVPKPEEMELAHKYTDLHLAGKDDKIPYKAMMLTTMVADAMRKVRLEHGPESFPLLCSAVKIGNVAMFGFPGEPFTALGREIKKAEGYDLVLPCCNTNAKEGYFPTQEAYDEGGYEARGSNFKAGVSSLLVNAGLEILKDLRK